MSWDCSIFGLRRPLWYRDRVCDLTTAQAPISCMTGSTDAPVRSQVANELLFQSAASLNEKASANRLVGHPQLRVAGILVTQPPRNLLRRPVLLEFNRDDPLQLKVSGKQAGLGTTR
jgi:hypothetical protein